MRVSMTVPTDDLGTVRAVYPELERLGYDRAFSFEAKHDPFLTLAVASEHTQSIRLGTAIAIAFARNPMNLANLGYDMQVISGGRFVLGLGTQVKAHIERRYSSEYAPPGPRMREYVQSLRAIFAAFRGDEELDFHGDYYDFSLLPSQWSPGPIEVPDPPIFVSAVLPARSPRASLPTTCR